MNEKALGVLINFPGAVRNYHSWRRRRQVGSSQFKFVHYNEKTSLGKGIPKDGLV